MTRQAEATESSAELFADEVQAGSEAEIDAVLDLANGDPRAAIRALLTQIGEEKLAHAAALAQTSLGYRRGMQPARPVRT